MQYFPGRNGAVLIFVQFTMMFNCFGQREATYPFSIKQNNDKPVLFGEGIISTMDDEFGGTFSPDGKTVYFSKSVPGSYLYTICYSEFKNDKWTTPEIMPFSGIYRDFDPVLSPDGNTMLFASDRPVDTAIKNDYDIWMTRKINNGWGDPIRLPAPINTNYDEHFASIAANGNLYFSSTRPGAVGGEYDSDVYRCRLVNGKYENAEHLDSVSTDAFELDVVIAPDETYLLIGAAGRPDGLGNFDIFISKNKNGVWSPARNAGKLINSPFRDYSPRISPDGKYLFFTSEKDFTTEGTQTAPFNYKKLIKAFHSTLNGTGNIYQIELNRIIKQD
jgi:Tol biopolymer transport system component